MGAVLGAGAGTRPSHRHHQLSASAVICQIELGGPGIAGVKQTLYYFIILRVYPFLVKNSFFIFMLSKH